ncbi:hypothetical protein D6C78_01529 [Aureobasidium pullulans]|uniref:Uncharacterized protein n=1 Tax=Aureobasidium pullulans TaxID=5580 RepID=A0A4T0C3T0_AURPU|nr:hypothetical protein D6C78_01529 [Aureobasidium pullulans]
MDAASPAHRVGGRLALSDPAVKKIAQASSSHNYFDELPKLQGEDDWHKWSDALQDAALMAGADAILNGESTHPLSLDDKQCTTAEWNDNIKRTAVWRRRNESLLKAMRDTMESDADIDMFGPLNAHKAYIGLKSRYYVFDNQKVINLYNDELMLAEIDLDDSPEEIADDFQAAFDQYNHLFDHNESQRLPENFLKLEFLNSLDDVYADWIKALLKEHDVLGLNQGPALTFNELVDMAVVEHNRLLQENTSEDVSAHVSAKHQPAKRNISEVEEDSHSSCRVICSLSHHQNYKQTHTNQECYTQNPRLRPEGWEPSANDKKYLAKHSEIEAHQEPSVSNSLLPANREAEARQEVFDEEEEEEDAPGAGHISDETRKLTLMHEQNWKQLAASRFAEVQAQRDFVTRTLEDKQTKKLRKHAPSQDLLSGMWLLFAQDLNIEKFGHCHMRLLESTTIKQKQQQIQQYRGTLTIGPYKNPETFEILTFKPSPRITGRPLQIHFRQSNGMSHSGEATFWGNGKMSCKVPAPCSNGQQGIFSFVEVVGIYSESVTQESRGGNHDDDSDDGSSSDVEDEERQNAGNSETDAESDRANFQKNESESSGELAEPEGPKNIANEQDWVQLAGARMAEVETQKTIALRSITKPKGVVPCGPISGLWRLYTPEYNPGPTGHHHIGFWEHIAQRNGNHHNYHCQLSIGPRENPIVYRTNQLSPSHVVKGNALQLNFPGKSLPRGYVTLWGAGKIFVVLPAAVLQGYKGTSKHLTFAGIWSGSSEYVPRKVSKKKRVKTQEVRHDLVMRAEETTDVAVKLEDEDTDMIIKNEPSDSDSNDSHEEWADDVATTRVAVQKQRDALRGGLVSPLHSLSGKWYLHSADYNPGLDKEVAISFYSRQEHDDSERMCAPGHCKSTSNQIRYCGELRFKAPVGERNIHCLIKQFDVPKEASLVPVRIEMWDPLKKRTIFMSAWFFGDGKMRMSIPTLCIRDYLGQNTMITFDGLKYGWTSHAE